MTNKTCGECKYFDVHKDKCLYKGKSYMSKSYFDACMFFEQKGITNGDKIRQGGNKALVIFKAQWDCDTCAYHIPKGDNDWARCKRPKDKTV